jgi:hypothetical protein
VHRSIAAQQVGRAQHDVHIGCCGFA